MIALTRRAALRAGVLGSASATQASTAALPAATPAATTVFNVTAYGALGDGKTDDTAAMQSAINAAAAVPGSTVYFPPASGGCYRTTGLNIPGGVAQLVGESALSATEGPSVVSLKGSVLAPATGTTATLLAVGISGNGAAVPGNPHGLNVEGLGFLGTLASGKTVPSLWGAAVTDTSDVTFSSCRDLFCGAADYLGYPEGGNGQGGFVSFMSSGVDDVFAVNGRVMFCSSYGAGTFLNADGLSAAYPGSSTDGRVVSCQVNGHGYGIALGTNYAGAGGWAVIESHFSSEPGINHINYGPAGNAWTLRVEGCYLDVCSDVHINCYSRGLLAIGNYFRGFANATSIRFGAQLGTTGRDPAAQIVGNTYDLNGNGSAVDFARFNGFTSAAFASNGGGEYRANLVHNHGRAMPASWRGQFTGSDAAFIPNTSTATLDLAQGPVLSG